MKKYDIVLFGASSFVGKITAEYMVKHLQTNADSKTVKFAIAGRSKAKLEKLKKQIKAKKLDILIADSHDEASLKAMVKQTKVVISTVGPYDLYGSLLVKTCAELGVDYCDLTGESHWIKKMIDAHGAKAFETGARIVNCCGFDSIPSDIGVHFLQSAAQEKFAMPCTKVQMRVKAAKGTVSGGTVASMVNVMKQIANDARLRKSLANPYQICPTHPLQQKTRQKNIKKPVFDSQHQRWLAPFIMAEINTKVVMRSNALTDYAYTPTFKYDEAMFTGKGTKGKIMAYTTTAGLASLAVGASINKTRTLLEKYVLPKPGEGPSKKAQEKGYYHIMFYGTTADGRKITTQCKGDRDPGYGSTAKMLAQAALCLLQDVPADKKGGFWTPASVFGNAIVPRLEKHAGVVFSTVN